MSASQLEERFLTRVENKLYCGEEAEKIYNFKNENMVNEQFWSAYVI